MSTGRIVVHMAVPDAMRVFASANMSGLDGGVANFSVELLAIGGDSLAWASFKSYGARFWGASQGMMPFVLLPMLEDGYANETEILYAAFDEDTGLPVDTGNPLRPGCNLTTQPSGPSYEEFMQAAGLAKVDGESPF